jgi:putative hydrolase of the HAD superfamily
MEQVPSIRAVVFDWGDTIMRDFPDYNTAMVYWPRVELIDGAREALAVLSPRFTCCLASNAGISDAELMGQALDRVAVRPYFHHLWTSKELGAAKPNPEFFLAITRRLGLRPEECVMVGNDYAKDIAGAKAAGLRTIWLAPAGAVLPVGGDTCVIYSLHDLPAALAGLR